MRLVLPARLGAMLVAVALSGAAAEPVRMRFPEGPTHGFLVLSKPGGAVLAHGELIQWLERAVVASQLVIRFTDGSLYDELVRFTQRPSLRLTSYHLVQRGPAFEETEDVEFDAAGRYRVSRRPKPDAEEQHAEGHVDVPEDVSNGLTSVLLRNVMPSGSATVHFLTFRPNPLVLELQLGPEGVDRCWIGSESKPATRFVIRPHVGGTKGAFATLAGRQPDERRMWLVQDRVPTLVRFEGPLYEGGPTWRIELAGPRVDR